VSAAQPSPHRFATAVDQLVNQVGHWPASRWAAGLRTGPPAPGPAVASRGDRVHALVQRLADLAADTEGRPRRPVPRLGDLVLADQARVMANDLLACAAPDRVMQQATEDVDAVRRTL
jgi:hypothetical protein